MSERYEIKGKIGQGGIGAVYRARDTKLKRDVAIKRLLSQEHKPEEERRTAEVLIKEAGMLSQLQHPNIVTVYDVGVDDDGGYVVMELIDGETFDQTIDRGALTATDFSQVVDQTLEAMIAAQQINMLHRDIKPSNVMVSWLPSGRFQVKVLDFGLAKLSQEPALQTIDHGDAIMGSIYFMAPEQFDRQLLDARTDLYSLGCLYYYGLTAKYPFDGKTGPEVMVAHLEHDVVPLAKLRPDLSTSACDWVMGLISQDMDDRPSSAAAALKVFKPILEEIQTFAEGADNASDDPIDQLPPSPNRPQLITGPVSTAPTYSTPLHTTGYQIQAKKSGPGAGVIAIWSLVAIVVLGTGWIIIGAGSDSDSKDKKKKSAPESSAQENEQDDPPESTDPIRPEIVVSTQPLIWEASRWYYLDKGAVPDNWHLAEFDETTWARGKSPLGFGDPVTTELANGTGDDFRITYHFRKTIEVDDPIPPDDEYLLQMRVRFDDGFRILLNGEELMREALPEGEIDSKTLASKNRDDRQEKNWEKFDFAPSILRKGKNVFAVEVHQKTLKSSDILFAMELKYRKR